MPTCWLIGKLTLTISEKVLSFVCIVMEPRCGTEPKLLGYCIFNSVNRHAHFFNRRNYTSLHGC